MTRFEETGRKMRIETYTGKTWIDAKELRVAETDARHLTVGDTVWVYSGHNCVGDRNVNAGVDECEAFIRGYIGRERVRFTREGF
jgi:hypothetical protein